MYKEIEGDLIQLALQGQFNVIGHGVNCQCVMGAGLALQMAKAFDCKSFKLESTEFKGDINKLGQIDFEYMRSEIDTELIVVNCYTQFIYRTDRINKYRKPLDYEALTLCLRKMNHIFKGKHIGLPLIGCGLAGGVWDNDEELPDDKIRKDVKTIIQTELKDCNITIVIYKK